ncbi:glycoside hydrolase family 20 protein [Phycomyces blakesleeanus]|uniref:Beta-hexosaminidase n=2 Tax=Phycomyces blakesleeanus TaxID=4837 RepID=A0A167NMP3_PHYB8|nr:glycoside hydrolase family 20 protein [Phycomyces blakesleeanus NRRL 1555(-)]OAD76294.1 glycoside hydrolase family 20 protein [Phycomyces blakesleeanus NRRL 1555(-)]|eukprot:XP_018294334.1 glycoside hydrolase family 20 protein [Phycomyces blakesleeanus NRRL 1555(-)]
MKISLAITAAAIAFGYVDAKTFLLPIPQSVEWTGNSASLSKDFKITGAKNPHVKDAAKRYNSLIHQEKWVPVQVPYTKQPALGSAGTLKSLEISVKDNYAKLDIGIDESYTLDVPSKGGKATLIAATWVGAIRGLETFSQLVESGKHDGLIAHTAHIIDHPTYGHRGILLDTARNFYPVKDILRTIDAMAFNKMNVLHWHVTDSQSWPLYFKSHPELSEKGAYSSKEVYSPKDVETIIRYGESRGVRLIVELDMPAHTATIAESHPDYMACIGEWWGDFAAEPPAGQLNPINEGAWKLVEDLIKEATHIFPDTLYHAGGDELNTACWPKEKTIVAYAEKHNMTYNEIWFEWENKLLDFVKTQKKRSIIWEDPIKDGGSMPVDTIVQTWLAPPSTYTAKGHDVIVSNYAYFYLDCGHGGWVGDDERYISPTQQETPEDTFNYGGVGGSWCSPFKTWQRIYSYDMSFEVKDSHPGKVLGGEAALWAEQSDYHVVDGRLWPRASAAAEIYWSGSYDNKNQRRTVEEFQPRFLDWVYRLQSRGINAEPVQPKWCAKHPQACDLNNPKKVAA